MPSSSSVTCADSSGIALTSPLARVRIREVSQVRAFVAIVAATTGAIEI